jgi:hypothetical protein
MNAVTSAGMRDELTKIALSDNTKLRLGNFARTTGAAMAGTGLGYALTGLARDAIASRLGQEATRTIGARAAAMGVPVILGLGLMGLDAALRHKIEQEWNRRPEDNEKRQLLPENQMPSITGPESIEKGAAIPAAVKDALLRSGEVGLHTLSGGALGVLHGVPAGAVIGGATGLIGAPEGHRAEGLGHGIVEGGRRGAIVGGLGGSGAGALRGIGTLSTRAASSLLHGGTQVFGVPLASFLGGLDKVREIRRDASRDE